MTQPNMAKSDWKLATEETNPRETGDYLTIYRDKRWQENFYVQRVCRFSLGNKNTGHIWDAKVGCENWNVKYWQHLPKPPEGL